MKDRIFALAIAAAFLGMLGLIAVSGDALNDEQERRIRAEQRHTNLVGAIEHDCTVMDDGSATCPPKTFTTMTTRPGAK